MLLNVSTSPAGTLQNLRETGATIDLDVDGLPRLNSAVFEVDLSEDSGDEQHWEDVLEEI